MEIEKMAFKPEASVENEGSYNASESLDRDFNNEWIYYDEQTGEPLIDDPDLNQIMNFYRQEAKPGTLISLGAGPNHFHYISAIEDRLSHVTALDLSQKHIDLLGEFVENMDKIDNPKLSILNEDQIEVLKCCAEANEIQNAQTRNESPRSGENILASLKEKSMVDGKPDLIYADMYDVESDPRKFDNVLLSYSIFANQESDVYRLMEQTKKRLNSGGKIIIADFQGFDGEDAEGQFAEDKEVLEKYPNIIDLSPELLSDALEKAGFKDVKIQINDPLFEAEDGDGEKERGYKYVFVSANL